MEPRVLFVDDDIELCKMAALGLEQHQIAVSWLTSSQAAAEAIHEQDYDVLVADVMMDELDGLRLCQQVTQRCPRLPVVLITAHGNLDLAISALRAGAQDLLTKPFGIDELARTIRRVALARRREDQALLDAVGTPASFGLLSGSSKVMRQLIALLPQISAADVPVLISGESGTGKRSIARALHDASVRRAGPFLTLSCVASSEEALESQLFGQSRGLLGHGLLGRGLLQQAEGGTLLLTEVDQLPLALQGRLLRELQAQQRLVNETAELALGVRVIMATSQDLLQASKEGRFSADLYAWMQLVQLQLPPLRERGEDVLLYAGEILRRYAQQQGKQSSGFSPDAARVLLRYPWPGNIRELESCLQKAAELSCSSFISEEDLPATLRSYGLLQDPWPGAKEELVISLEELELSYIQQVLDVLKGNKSLAAKLLGIDRATLYRKLARAKERAAEREVAGQQARGVQVSLRLS